MNASRRVEVDALRKGTRTVLGTDWPVEDVVERRQFGRKVLWVVVRGRCNGTADGSTEYGTREEALKALWSGR